MKVEDLLDEVRSVLRDKAKPYLWSDDQIVRYLNEAQEKITRATFCFVKADELLDLDTGVDIYDLPSYVQYVYRVNIAGAYGSLGASTDNWTPTDSTPGLPQRFTLDTETQSIRFWPVPDTAYSATLRIARMPDPLSVSALEAEPAIPEKYQLSMVDWAAYRCFTHDDSDGRNDKAAENARARYIEAVDDHKQDLYRLKTGASQRVSGNRIK